MNSTILEPSTNPFGTPEALRHSAYCASQNGKLERLLDARQVGAEAEFAHLTLRAAILHPDFPCVVAKASVNRGTLRTAHYSALANPAVTQGLARDLFEFVREQAHPQAAFSTFVATFAYGDECSELTFEQTMWRQLRLLRDLDAPHSAWDPTVDADPSSPRFAYSFGAMAFFVVGMHRSSGRWARRLPFAALAFNPRRQFDQLRSDGVFERMQQVIRAADRRLQGSINPMLDDTVSEARQYTGRAVEADWRCPFLRAPE